VMSEHSVASLTRRSFRQSFRQRKVKGLRKMSQLGPGFRGGSCVPPSRASHRKARLFFECSKFRATFWESLLMIYDLRFSTFHISEIVGVIAA
jgi:hypothetical protein